jgi:hypothetical protein
MSLAVLSRRPGVAAGGLEAPVAGEVGDGRQVNALAHEPGDVREPPIKRSVRSAPRAGSPYTVISD